GADYSQASPVVEGYKLAVPEQATISGVMPAENVTVTVNYVASAGLTINYVIKGTSTPVAQSYIDEDLYEGDPYSVESPTVEHYHLVNETQATISGTMPAGQVTITVEYELDEITITWTDIEGTHELKGAYGTDVTVPTPAEDTHNIFTGWLKDGSPAEFPTTFTENATYTANYDVVYPKLIARNPDKTTVDRDRHIVYGFADEDGDVYVTLQKLTGTFLDVEGNGTMQVTPAYTYNDKGLYGTGAVVTVIDNATGLPVEGETFTVVVFGDLNGDGRVTSVDTTAIRNEIAGNTTWSDPESADYNAIKLLAGDIDHNGSISSVDTTAVRANVACTQFIEQNPTL
ncbi:MAG: dockerin type I repeat-containing protein, partial [Clostridia bacterium]|nr:dockerin type I repeat-containing protein [Clostridia bacterium]